MDKVIVWGADEFSKQYIRNSCELNIIGIVDSRENYQGQFVGELKVESPNILKDYVDVKIVVVEIPYKPIKEKLESYGYIENIDFWDFHNKVNFYSLYELDEMNQALLARLKKIYGGKTCINMLFGDFVGDHKNNAANFMNLLANRDRDKTWLFFSEDVFGRDCEKFSNFESLHVPIMFAKKQFRILNCEDIVDASLGNYAVDSATAIMKAYGGDSISESYAKYVCQKAYYFYIALFEFVKPEVVYIWNQYRDYHKIIADVCREKLIKVIYVENGALPGTIQFDEDGEMGESWVSYDYEKFNQIDVSEEEFIHAQKVVSYLRESKINRYIQQDSERELENLKKRMDLNNPIILYAGQLDYFTGMLPYDDCAKKYYSPIFSTSDEAAEYLKELAKENHWNLIYKPHPWLPTSLVSENGFYCVDKLNLNDLIDICDVVVTIQSTVSYIALLRDKPVVMMGYILLRGKGCTYEVFEKLEIENTLKKALKYGYTPQMKENFLYHIARMEKVYLYDDTSPKDMVIGKLVNYKK